VSGIGYARIVNTIESRHCVEVTCIITTTPDTLSGRDLGSTSYSPLALARIKDLGSWSSR